MLSNSKAELSELSKYIDVIHKQQRLPLEEEMDWIMVSTFAVYISKNLYAIIVEIVYVN